MSPVLFLHETHSVVGRCEEEFEAAFGGPGGYMERLAATDDARLLWYLDHVHGAGPAYTVTTITALRDAPAWERLADRIAAGDLRDWAARLDRVRYDAGAKLLQPLPWSELQTVDLAEVPVTPADHGLVLYMEDTAVPYRGRLHDYIDAAGEKYAPSLRHPASFLELVGAFQPAFGAGRRQEVVLWQRVVDDDALLQLFTTSLPKQMKRPGTWMHDALEVRDQWTSRLLRTSSWSPLA